jgi:hypothetical protein
MTMYSYTRLFVMYIIVNANHIDKSEVVEIQFNYNKNSGLCIVIKTGKIIVQGLKIKDE